jgi:ABC-type multidrug transport system ATPase subunit
VVLAACRVKHPHPNPLTRGEDARERAEVSGSIIGLRAKPALSECAVLSQSAGDAAVEVDGVTKTFPAGAERVSALRALSVRIRCGCITGLVGPDGSGKTTLLRLIGGLLAPDAGRILVLGLDAVEQSELIRMRLGYMPQRFGLYEDLSVEENLTLYADMHGLPRSERPARFDELLQFTGLGRFRTRLAGRLSGGMKQKLGLACTLVRPPEILLLDEPSVGVDPVSRRELWQIVRRLAGEGMTVVWSTAYLEEAERCDEVVVLHQGQLLGQAEPGDFLAPVRGRTFALRTPPGERRTAGQRALAVPGVLDAVIQGTTVRLLLAAGTVPPPPFALVSGEAAAASEVVAVEPRFEDAVIALLRERAAEGDGDRIGRNGRVADVPADLTLARASSQRGRGQGEGVSGQATERTRRGRAPSPPPSPTRKRCVGEGEISESAAGLQASAHAEERGLSKPALSDVEGGARWDSMSKTPPASEHRPASRPVIEIEQLTRVFGDFRAVDGISLSVPAGETFGLLGPNGAGKSTTFKMLCGLLPPSAGKALVLGIDLGHAAAAARARIGYMSQKFALYGALSVLQNLRFFGSAYGLTGRRRGARIDRMLDEFDLHEYAERTSEDLPLGYKQRLSLACAILHEPEILFLDEPTSGVDPLTRREFWARINAMAAAGVTVMVTTHFLDEAEYCDRLGIVYRGQLIALGSADELKARARAPELPDPTLDDAFIGLIEAYDREHPQ